MTKWEYKVLTLITQADKDKSGHRETAQERDQRIESSLSGMGQEGWELVTFMPAAHFVETTNPWIYHAVFKRPIED